MKRFFVALGTLCLLNLSVWAQGQYEQWSPSTEYNAAEELFHTGNFLEAARAHEKIASDNPHTSKGGASNIRAGTISYEYLRDVNAAIRIWSSAARDFQGSAYEINAELCMVRARAGRTTEHPDDYLAALNELSVKFGGPKISTISEGSLAEANRAAKDFRVLPQQAIKGLATVFLDAQLLMTAVGRHHNSLVLGAFNRASNYDGTSSDVAYRSMARGAAMLKFGRPAGVAPRRDPTLVAAVPAAASVVPPSQTSISVSFSGGDVFEPGIELHSLRFEVDGEEVLKRSELTIETNADVQRGRPFETLTVKFYRASGFAPGTHAVHLLARTIGYTGEGPGKLDVQWSFTVANSPPPSTNQTLQVAKDSLIYEKSPHSNEGANPKLTLEKITGKASRNVLGFNLSGINAATVSKATLVLTIDPTDQATGWGNGETVNVKPVTVAWQEGNGKSYGLSSSQQTAGSGAGTTWFSPTDDNISNNSSNSVTQWSGGATYATTGAAPAMTVSNHQTEAVGGCRKS